MPTLDSNEELRQQVIEHLNSVMSFDWEKINDTDREEGYKLRTADRIMELFKADKQAAIREAVRLAHLAGRIEEAQNIKVTYTRRDGPSSVLNSVLTKRLKRYRGELHKVFTDHKASLNQPMKEETP